MAEPMEVETKADEPTPAVAEPMSAEEEVCEEDDDDEEVSEEEDFDAVRKMAGRGGWPV